MEFMPLKLVEVWKISRSLFWSDAFIVLLWELRERCGMDESFLMILEENEFNALSKVDPSYKTLRLFWTLC